MQISPVRMTAVTAGGESMTLELPGDDFSEEAVAALVESSFERPAIEHVMATVDGDDEESIRTLLAADFVFVGDAAEPGPLRLERWRGPVMTAKPFYLSAIPADAVASHKLPEGCQGAVKYFLDSDQVGYRHFDDGVLTDERAYRNGKMYGRQYTWHPNGVMSSMEAVDRRGMSHGTAYQWDEDSELIGSYTMNHGTGVDLWWSKWPGEATELHEVHFYRDGERHGYEWWLSEGGSIFSERHWHQFQEHGIERQWNSQKRISHSYPRYWIHGERVNKARYL